MLILGSSVVIRSAIYHTYVSFLKAEALNTLPVGPKVLAFECPKPSSLHRVDLVLMLLPAATTLWIGVVFHCNSEP